MQATSVTCGDALRCALTSPFRFRSLPNMTGPNWAYRGLAAAWLGTPTAYGRTVFWWTSS